MHTRVPGEGYPLHENGAYQGRNLFQLAGRRVGPQLRQPVPGVAQARSSERGDSGGKVPPAASPHPNSRQGEGVVQKAREAHLKNTIPVLGAHPVAFLKFWNHTLLVGVGSS